MIRYGKPIANSQILIEENSTKQIKVVVLPYCADEVEKAFGGDQIVRIKVAKTAGFCFGVDAGRKNGV